MIPDSRYREYWAYLRHVESLRFQLVGVVAAVVTAVLRFGLDYNHLTLRTLLVAAALTLFIGFAGYYLIAHKKSYDDYARRTRLLEPREDGRQPARFWSDAFTWLLSMMTVLQLVVGAMASVISPNPKWKLSSWVAGAPIALLAVVFVASWWGWWRSIYRGTHPPRTYPNPDYDSDVADPTAHYRWQFTLSVSWLAASAAVLTLSIVADEWTPCVLWLFRVLAGLLLVVSLAFLIAGLKARPGARHQMKWSRVQLLLREAGQFGDSLAVEEDGYDASHQRGAVAAWIGDVRAALKEVDPVLLTRFGSGDVRDIPRGAAQLRSYLADRANELRTFMTQDR